MQVQPADSVLIRVWIPLPYSRKTAHVIDEVITLLTENFGGCTFSKPSPAGEFRGRWRNHAGEVEQDRDVVMIWVDVEPDVQAPLFDFLRQMKANIEKVETAAWITYHRVEKVA